MADILSRREFRERCVDRDDGKCLVPWCSSRVTADPDGPGEVHHIIERALWDDGGWYAKNGASVCNDHHQYAEENFIPPHAFWRWLDVEPLTPEGMPTNINKWGPDEQRRGETLDTPPHEDLREFHKYPSTRHLLPLYWQSSRGTVEERTGRDDTGLQTVEPFLGVPLAITEKMDGCLPYNQEVITKEQGAVKIGKVVNQKMDVKVLSYNFTTGEKEYRPVVNHFRNGKTDNWLRVEHDGDSQSSRIVVTPNHEMYLSDGSTKLAGELEPGDELASSVAGLSGEQEELVVGSMLGDAHLQYRDNPDDVGEKLRNPFIKEAHSIEQSEYVQWKCEIFGGLVNNTYTRKSVFNEDFEETKKMCFATQTLPSLQKFKDFVADDGGRTLPDWVELSPKSLAVWYCDDGSVLTSDAQRPRAQFATNCFSHCDCEKLIEMLQNFGVNGRVADYGKGPRIEITADGTEALFEEIAPYIPECMSYKVPEEYRVERCEWNGTSSNMEHFEVTEITEAETFSPIKFDIEVEGNHNYFSSQVLVSNSNAMLVKDMDEPVRARNGAQADHESFDLLKQLYWENDVYAELPEHIQVFGEWLYTKHSIHYGCDCNEECEDTAAPLGTLVDGDYGDQAYFQVFGAFDTRYNLWLSWPEVEQVADTLGFPTVPLVRTSGETDYVRFTDEYVLKQGLLGVAEDRVDAGGEGIVVRWQFPYHWGQFDRALGKYVRPNHVKTDDHWTRQDLPANRL